MSASCPACGTEIVYQGRGRPRKFCEKCNPPGGGGATWRKAWLTANWDRLEAERQEWHAAWMAQWRANMRRNRETIAENRRRLDSSVA